jgi:hypothetical protein
MLIRLGQAHGIDELMPERRPGDLIVPCPACPEVGLNIKGDIPEIPPWLRYGIIFWLSINTNVDFKAILCNNRRPWMVIFIRGTL